MRSYDLGKTWDVDNATQLAAGGGQEFAPIYLGHGRVGGLLAMHEVVPVAEAGRAGLTMTGVWPRSEYPVKNVGGFWCWSDNHGLSWHLHHAILFAPGLQTCAAPIRMRAGALLAPVYGSHDQENRSSSVLFRSDDNGRTWSQGTLIAGGSDRTRSYVEPSILELKKDHLLALHRVEECHDGRSGLFWRNESLDGGKTWSEPVETDILSGACPRLLKLSDGRILVTFGRRYAPLGLYAQVSDDGGQTWGTTSWLLREFPTINNGYSSSVEINPGRIFTVCYAHDSDKGPTTADGTRMAPNSGITGTFWNLPHK